MAIKKLRFNRGSASGGNVGRVIFMEGQGYANAPTNRFALTKKLSLPEAPQISQADT